MTSWIGDVQIVCKILKFELVMNQFGLFIICFLIEKLQRALTEAGVSSVDELKESIEKTTASIQRLQSKVSCDEDDDLLKSVSTLRLIHEVYSCDNLLLSIFF
jgi:hypothetical protein